MNSLHGTGELKIVNGRHTIFAYDEHYSNLLGVFFSIRNEVLILKMFSLVSKGLAWFKTFHSDWKGVEFDVKWYKIAN